MIWKTPSGQAFASRVQADLASGKNAVLLIPKPLIKGSLVGTLKDNLWLEGKGRLSAVDTAEEPFSGAADLAALVMAAREGDEDMLAVDLPSDPTLPGLYRTLEREIPLKILALTGLERLPGKAQGTVLQGLADWADMARQPTRPHDPPSGLRFLVVAPPDFHEISTDLFLTRHVFWGNIQQSDLDWAFRLELAANPPGGSRVEIQAEHLFLKAVCLALCSEDFGLMGELVAVKPKSLDEIAALLKRHPLRTAFPSCRFSGQGLLDYRDGSLVGWLPPPRPTERLAVSLWSEGLLWATGPSRFHPVLLEEDELEKTIAVAQREVFLTAVDRVHSLLLKAVEMAFGTGVWDHYEKSHDNGREKVDDILSEISPLAFFIQRDVEPLGVFSPQVKRAAMDCAFSWRHIRHVTSHNRMASFEKVLKAVKNYDFFLTLYERMAGRHR